MTYLSFHRFGEISIEYKGGILPNEAIVFCKGEYTFDALTAMNPNGKYILITGGGDVYIDEKYISHIKSCLHYWFAQNLVITHDKIEAIPYGLSSSYLHGLSDQEKNLEISLNIERENNNKILICHSIPASNYPYYVERTETIKILSDKSYCVYYKELNRNILYSEMRKYNYMISTIGMGFDCMRTWESIYLGSIPICKRYPFNSTFTDMPIVFVDDWNDINEKWLDENLNSKNKSSERCYWEYWRNRVLTKAKEIGL